MFRKLLIVLFLAVMAAGCAATRTLSDNGWEQITASEQQELVRRARNVVMGDLKNIRQDQAKFVKGTEPEVKISYAGDCSGQAIITWVHPESGKTFHVTFSGVLNSDSTRDLQVRYTTVRDTTPTIIPDNGSTLRPPQLEISRKEWLELKNK